MIGEASDGAAAVALAERRRPDVVIMDVRMPGMDGLEATKILSETAPDVAVLIFTAYSERRLLAPRARVGREGLHPQGGAAPDAAAGDREGRRGRGLRRPGADAGVPTADQDEMLTAREREILQLLADGMSNADVAAKLFISQETVKSHVRHILAKLEADTRTQAVAIALREAIID